MLLALLLINNEKCDVAEIEYQKSDPLPAVQRTLFPGKHKEKQQQTGENHSSDIDIIFRLKRQRLNAGADSEHEKDVENIWPHNIAHGNIHIFL